MGVAKLFRVFTYYQASLADDISNAGLKMQPKSKRVLS